MAAVVPKQRPATKPQPSGRVMLSPGTAAVFRAAAKYLGISLDELAQRMIQDYLPRHAPQLDLVFEDESPIAKDMEAAQGGSSIFGSDPIGSRSRPR